MVLQVIIICIGTSGFAPCIMPSSDHAIIRKAVFASHHRPASTLLSIRPATTTLHSEVIYLGCCVYARCVRIRKNLILFGLNTRPVHNPDTQDTFPSRSTFDLSLFYFLPSC